MTDDPTSMYAVGRRVASRRVLRGLGQQALAAAVGYERSHITRIEAGHRHLKPKMAEQLAAILGTTADYLLYGTGDDDRPR